MQDENAGKNFEDVDWDAINSDELDSEQLDEIEKNGTFKPKNDINIKFTSGFETNVGKDLLEKKKEKQKEKEKKLSPFE